MPTRTNHLTADWTVNQVAGTYPASLPVLGRYGIDSCCGGARTLRAVAAAHDFPLERLLADLIAATVPPLVLDVRPDLRAGREPFATIMAAVQQLAPGQDLVLQVDFEPVPLYSVLQGKGFGHRTERTADGAWQVTFSREG